MPNYSYSIGKNLDPDRTAKASVRNINVSRKALREVCRAIKGMKIDQAKDYLKEVIEKKRSVPYRRHKTGVGHKSDLQGWAQGRYPVKTCKEMLKLVDNLENNAEANQLQVDKCKIIHAAALQGMKIRGIFPRAQGRSTPKIKQLMHAELVAEVME